MFWVGRGGGDAFFQAVGHDLVVLLAARCSARTGYVCSRSSFTQGRARCAFGGAPYHGSRFSYLAEYAGEIQYRIKCVLDFG